MHVSELHLYALCGTDVYELYGMVFVLWACANPR